MPSLKSLQLGAYCFMRSCHTVIASRRGREMRGRFAGVGGVQNGKACLGGKRHGQE